MLPALLFHLARDDATTDRWADAETAYDEAIRLSRETGQTTELGIALAGLAWLHAHQGRADDCRRRAAEAVRICREHQIHLGHAWALFALGDLELGRGAAGRRAAALRAARRAAGHDGRAGRRPVAGPGAGRRLRPARPYGRTRAGPRRRSRPAPPTRASRGRWPGPSRAAGLVGAGRPAGRALRRGARPRTSRPWTCSRPPGPGSRTAPGCGGPGAGSTPATQLRQAVAAFDRLGATGWADLAAAELKATGETARRREPSTAADLTPQERQIALLLADGRSTREAAAAMFLSPKTIEYHLRNVYTKLGIHSRAELAPLLKPE